MKSTMSEVPQAIREALPDKWEITDILGHGGQGTVFRGSIAGTPAAMKVFHPTADPRRLERELDCLVKINCPNLVKVLQYTTVSLDGFSCPLVAYELLEGGDLRVAPARSGNVLCTVGKEIGNALGALWASRIVHRDVKPANIVRAQDGRHVLVDLGLARHLDRSNLTAQGLVAGTIGYMSPEQARGRRNLTIHSDVFSLGVTLYEIASGRHPFSRQQHLIGSGVKPRPLAEFTPDISPLVASAIHRMLATIPAERPHKVAELFSEIARR